MILTRAPGGLFTPLLFDALIGSALGALWLSVVPVSHGDIGLFALLGVGAKIAATTQGPISALMMMLELTGQARLTDEEVAGRLTARERGSLVHIGRGEAQARQ